MEQLQIEGGRIIENDEDLYGVVADSAETLELMIHLAEQINAYDDKIKLETIMLLANKRYEDLCNGLEYLGDKKEL